MSDTNSIDTATSSDPPDDPVEKGDDTDTNSASSDPNTLDEPEVNETTSAEAQSPDVGADASSLKKIPEAQEVTSISAASGKGKAPRDTPSTISQAPPNTPSTISQPSTAPPTPGPSTGASTAETKGRLATESDMGSRPNSLQNTSVRSAPSSLPLDDTNIFFRHDDGDAIVKALAPQRAALWKAMADANRKNRDAKRKEEKDKENAEKARFQEEAREYIPPRKPSSIYSSFDENGEEEKSPSDTSSISGNSSLKSSSSSKKAARVDDSLDTAKRTPPSKKATSANASAPKGGKPPGVFDRFVRWLVSSRFTRTI